ncbi:hypothetical protein B0J12DRAFT_741758 [Macrophomina phaseolina]|uniref:Glycosyltransferase 2-like domain-containing protein n=1 Tax=Macrophomina phaseolina TaxID=35725 RepID=A0ABQ8GA19_9PEZI|nr:hypothetical protein B0J12DRAFT_741758 [Macrophomina phaseolina]
MKRAALAEVGGFPELSVTEDLLLGNLILGRGWRAAYVFETLQWGLVPDSFHGHIEQRKRWNTGAVQAGMIMRFCLFGDKAKHLDFRQRLFGFTCPFSSSLATVGLLQAVQNLAFFAGGWSNAVYADAGELKQLVRVAAFMWIMNFLRRCNTAVICGYAIAFRDNYCTEFLGCYWALAHLKTFILPRWLGGKEKAFSARFVATGSIVDPLNERDEKLRAPWQQRVRSVLFHDGAIFPVLLGCGFVLALCLNIRRAYGVYLGADSSEFWTFLLTRLFWMPPEWPSNIVYYFRPLQYALFPPSVPDREALLVRDENNVAYPTSEAKKTRTTWNGFGAEIVPTVLTAYTVGVLISTWWW